ncbi:MAG TPA: tRNA (adenosine(37)-N6)-threonylcarbamoyltransferase complex ATPase subunit type 1 TsaE [Saprospiraceae bacterium]|nr:tRNA (adenosine(37)-N6)-threonylcarbamoyltransferase complex ATPase subunit type 1 TsaE [Saprospiraceae bacterium]
MKLKEFIVEDLEGYDTVAKYLLGLKSKYNLFYLKGDLGAGKTTLVQKVSEYLDAEDQVVSPSFALINIYDSPKGEIYHIDLYRLDNLDEIIDLGIEDYLYSDNFCFVEWPEMIENISPEEYFEINIEIINDFKRKIIILRKEK